MAEHDYVIDNQSAPSFRTDLNNALMAIVSQNSKSTAPTTTYANMIWYDTTNNQLKKRNEANSAWITLGTVDEGAGTFTPSGERALATQAQAEAGTDNTTLMTPLRAAQAIAALTPAPTLDYELITSTTISSPVSYVDFTSGFNSGVYSAYEFVFSTVKPSTSYSFAMRYSTDGGSTFLTSSYFDTASDTKGLISLSYSTVSAVKSGVNGSAKIIVPNGANETITTFNIVDHDGSARHFNASVGGHTTSSTVNAVRFFFWNSITQTYSNTASGRIDMYGIRRV